jgi:hypothetical protein
MSKITLQAGSTFWFDYPLNPPARWISIGQPFEIESKDFPLYEAVGKELLNGKLPEAPKPFAERVAKIAQNLSDVLSGKPKASPDKHPCPHCGTVFTAAKGLEIHLRNAHKEIAKTDEAPAEEPKTDTKGKHKCPKCPKSFDTKTGLEIHIGHIHEDHHSEEA